MSVAEPLPPEDDDERRKREVEREADGIEIPDEVPEPPVTGSPIKDICKSCMRPVLQMTTQAEKTKYPSGWAHLDPRIDISANPAYHVAELFVEPPVRWGFLDTRGLALGVGNKGPKTNGHAE